MEEVLLQDLPKKFQQLNKNVKFAGVVALTRMAIQGRLDVIESAKRNFTLRNKWVIRGIRYKRADIKQPEPFSEVFTKDDYMYEHEEGGNRVLKMPGYVHVGTRQIFGIPPMKVIPRSLYGANLDWTQKGSARKRVIKGKRTFKKIFTSRSGRQKIGRFIEESTQTFKPIKLMIMEQATTPVKIRKRPWFKPAMDKSYDKNFQKIYDAAWDQFVVRKAL